jgi:16S rRNA U1498 N3-methylase RsmE
MEPRSVGNVKYFCVEPAGHQCEHRYVPSIDDVERLAARVRELEAERDALRALLREARGHIEPETSWCYDAPEGWLEDRVDAALTKEKT